MFLLGFVIAWRLFRTPVSLTDPANITALDELESALRPPINTPSSFTKPAVISGAARISVREQLPGFSVALDKVELGQDYWIAIRESRDNEPGNILGAQRFRAGTYENVLVELLRDTIGGESYYAELRQDNGDDTFSIEDDTPVTDVSGKGVLVLFSVIGSPMRQ